MTPDSVLKVLEASQAPLKFDIIENFRFDDPDHKEKMLKNNSLLVGNLGKPGSKYVENTKFNKDLDLGIHSNLR